MNKKFSTLIAALLVSGLGFALVSSFNGLPMSDSPVAKAATTNLRAVASEATEATAEAAFTDKVFDETDAVWNLKPSGDGYFWIACGSFYVTNDARLSKNVALAAKFAFADDVSDYAIYTVGTPRYLARTADGLVFSEDRNSALGAFTSAGEATRLFDGTTTLIISDLTDPDVFTAGTHSALIGTAAAPASLTGGLITSATGGSVTQCTPFSIVAVESDFYLSFKDAAGTPQYITKDGTFTPVAAKAGQLTLSSSDYKCIMIGGKYIDLNINSFNMVDSENPFSSSLYITDGKILQNLRAAEVIYVAVKLSYNVYEWKYLYLKNDKGALAAVGEGVTAAAALNPSWTAEPKDGATFAITITDAAAYLAFDAVTNTVNCTAASAIEGLGFTAEDVTGFLMSGDKYLVYSVDATTKATTKATTMRLVKTLSAGQKHICAYAGTGKTASPATPLTAGEYTLGEDVTTSEDLSSSEKVPLLTAKLTASANLIDGENYYIKDGNSQNALHMEKETDGKFYLYAHDLEADCEVALKAAPVITSSTLEALWTAKKIEVTGQAPRYQFKNLETGKLLAFGYDKTDKNVVFNPDGLYNTFEFEDESLIFTVAEKDANGAVIGKLYVDVYVDVDADVDVITNINKNPATLTFSLPAEKPAGWNVDDQIHYLNVTAGSGNGFGLVFKDKVADKLKDLAVEKNVFSDASMITAIALPDDSEYPKAMLLKVDGTFPLPGVPMEEPAQMESFRTSTFIVVDTVRYSSIIDDQASDGFIKFTTAKGSEMMNKNGDSYGDYDIKGVTRRIENALFQIDQVIGGKTTDPVYVYAPEAYLPEANVANVSGLEGHTVKLTNAYIAIKNFNGKNYVGAVEGKDSRWEYVFIGKNNDVDYTKVNGIVNIYSANYKTEGQIFANANINDNNNNRNLDNPIELCDAKDVCANYPEGQFLVNYDKKTGEFLFTNRETGGSVYTFVDDPKDPKKDPMPLPCRLKAVAGKANVYAVVGIYTFGVNDTIKIVPAKVGDKYAGYQNYNETINHAISDSVYTLAIQPTIEGLEKTPFYIKESHATDHKLCMTTEKADMAKFKLVKFEDETDTIKVSVDYYIDAKGVEVQDSAVAFLYAIYNVDNNEYVRYNNETGKEFFFCDPKCMVDDPKAQPLRFLLKQKADGAYNLVATDFDVNAVEKSKLVGKVFGASVANKLAAEKNFYKITENDLITIKAVAAPEYRKIVAAPFDTIRIYKEGLPNVALYANTADKSIVSGEHFLGMTYKAEATKAQYSFFVDTAFVNRTNNNKYQYLLVLDADTVHGKVPCSDPTHAPHDSGRIDTVYGKFLVNAVDSIASWGTKHSNPYFWETTATPKLAFVNAAHVGDSLIIKSSMFTGKKALASMDTINLKNGLTKASFAFRIVDQETQSFVIETAGKDNKDGFIKWLNGTPVVVSDMNEAEIFNASKTTNKPTANEDLNASAVTVIAGNGNVTVLNAAGRTVVISNMLGQTIANTVLTSDNQTIAANGIVVVAVEGEEAVKAIIK